MRRALIVLASLVLAHAALAQSAPCTPELDFSGIPPGVAFTERPWGITFTNCTGIDKTMFPEKSTGTLTVGGIQYTAVVQFFVDAGPGHPFPQLVFLLQLDQGASDPVSVFYGSDAAQFQYTVNGKPTTWTLAMTEALNQKSNSIHIGRADANQSNQPAIPPAYELKIASNYSRQPAYAGAKAPINWDSLQQDFQFKVDTTDKTTGYVDDNSVTYGAFLPHLKLQNVVAQGKIGAQVDYQRPIHNNDHNADATVTAAGYLPFLRAANLFASKRRLASPLSIEASYGYRSKRMTGSTYRGRVFSGTAFYHLYVMDNYRLDLTATTTYNDLDNLPAGTTRTQHAFTASVYYEPSPNAPFNAVASFQNGSFGAVLTKLKQYFIGVSVTKIDQYLQEKVK